MAIIDGSSVTTNVRGSIGSTTYGRNRAGNFARERKTPVNPNTARQQQARAQMLPINTRWKNLTNGQRLNWMAAAESSEWARTNRFGRRYQPSGYQLFMQLNLQLAYFLIQVNDVPPKAIFPSVVPTSFVTSADSPRMDLIVNFSASSFSTDFRLLVFATDNLSLGIMKSKPQYFRWIGHFSSADLSPNLNFKFGWANAFGLQSTPQRVFCKLYLVSTISGERIEVGLLPNY